MADEYHGAVQTRMADLRKRALAGLVSPFVVVQPAWLTGAAPLPRSSIPWRQRRLLLFTGHVPKLYHSGTRYLLWRSLHRDDLVTSHSYDINCTIGQFAGCAANEASFDRMSGGYLRNYCRPYCGGVSSAHLGLASTAISKCSPDVDGYIYAEW